MASIFLPYGKLSRTQILLKNMSGYGEVWMSQVVLQKFTTFISFFIFFGEKFPPIAYVWINPIKGLLRPITDSLYREHLIVSKTRFGCKIKELCCFSGTCHKRTQATYLTPMLSCTCCLIEPRKLSGKQR